MNTNYNTFVGVDVSKATLDISLSGKHFKINNTEKALSLFIEEEIVKKNITLKLICLESTGGYEICAIKCFNKNNLPIHRAHPNRVHAFASASGHFAKTDKLDAGLLEKYAAFVCNEESGDEPISENSYQLRELRSVERNLSDSLHAYQCRIKHLHGKAACHIQVQINFILKQIIKVRKNIDEIIESDKQLIRTREILMSFKGVGQQVSNTLITELPELGTLNKREVANLVGVAPKTYESGTKKIAGHIMGGRFYARKALYMAALVASKHNEKMKIFYDRLLAAGKAKKVALVAVMRKIIIYLNGMIKCNKIYSEFILDF